MTATEIDNFLSNRGVIDCGNDKDTKFDVIELLKRNGFHLGFPEEWVIRYRYIYCPNMFDRAIHMRNTGSDLVDGEFYAYNEGNIIHASDILSTENNDTNIDKSKLYDWAEFFLATE